VLFIIQGTLVGSLQLFCYIAHTDFTDAIALLRTEVKQILL